MSKITKLRVIMEKLPTDLSTKRRYDQLFALQSVAAIGGG